MSEKPKKLIIYIRNQGKDKQKEIYQTLYRLISLVTSNKSMKLVGVLIESDDYVWQRPIIINMYESKKIDGVVCEDFSELCFSNKTYLEVAFLIDKGFHVYAIDSNGQLAKIEN